MTQTGKPKLLGKLFERVIVALLADEFFCGSFSFHFLDHGLDLLEPMSLLSISLFLHLKIYKI